ncbi:MAG: DUF3617 domain-containing protein [Halioglobus sp.]
MTSQPSKPVGAILLVFALSAHAEPLDIKPGLWTNTSTTTISGMPVPAEALKNMPPEQRAQLEAAMKAHQSAGPETITEETCITKEDLNKPFDNEDNENCTNTIVSATAAHAEYKIDCTGSDAHHGVMKIDALSRESVKFTLLMKTDNATVTNETVSKWVADDCGNVE